MQNSSTKCCVHIIMGPLEVDWIVYVFVLYITYMYIINWCSMPALCELGVRNLSPNDNWCEVFCLKHCVTSLAYWYNYTNSKSVIQTSDKPHPTTSFKWENIFLTSKTPPNLWGVKALGSLWTVHSESLVYFNFHQSLLSWTLILNLNSSSMNSITKAALWCH